MTNDVYNHDPLIIAGKEFRSRLMLGTGKFPSHETMAAALDASLLATELADYLVRKGVPFRQAHHVVGQAVQMAQGGRLDSLGLDELRELSPAFEADVQSVWNVWAAVNRRAAMGGAGAEALQAQIHQARAVLHVASSG